MAHVTAPPPPRGMPTGPAPPSPAMQRLPSTASKLTATVPEKLGDKEEKSIQPQPLDPNVVGHIQRKLTVGRPPGMMVQQSTTSEREREIEREREKDKETGKVQVLDKEVWSKIMGDGKDKDKDKDKVENLFHDSL